MTDTAKRLLEEALFMRMYGERPPNAPEDPTKETWHEWDVRCEEYLRTLFDPDWCIHPGVTFNECLKERGIQLPIGGNEHTEWKWFYMLANYAVLAEIDYHKADLIVELLGEPQTSPGFWVRLSNNYQEGLRAGKKDTTPR